MNTEIYYEEEKKINYISNKEKSINNLLTMIIIMTYIFSNQLRIGFIGEKFGTINFISIIIIIYIGIRYFNFFDYKYICIFFIATGYYIITSFYYQDNLIVIIQAYATFILPLIIVGLRISSKAFKVFFRHFIKIFNVVIFTITVLGIVDYFLNYGVISLIASFMSVKIQELVLNQTNDSIYRLYSFMGHPLFNAQLYLMFYILNNLYNKYIEKLIPNYIILVISVLGIALTASKTAFVLCGICIITIYGKKIKIRYYICLIFIILISFKLGVFDNTIARFMSGSLTTGRSEQWEIIKSMNLFPIKFFLGYGTGFTFYYNNFIPWASAAFEYPIRMFSLELGIMMMLLIYLCILIYPSYKLIKQKQFKLFIGYLIIFIDVNTYNGLSVTGDYMLIFSVFIFLILNFSSYIEKNN